MRVFEKRDLSIIPRLVYIVGVLGEDELESQIGNLSEARVMVQKQGKTQKVIDIENSDDSFRDKVDADEDLETPVGFAEPWIARSNIHVQTSSVSMT